MIRNKNIRIKKFTYNYTKDLLRIFNSGRASGFFFRSEKVSLKDHLTWLKLNVDKKKSFIFLGFSKDNVKPFGYVRFDLINQNLYEISIANHKSFCGKGYGSEMMRLAIKKFYKVKKIIAIVKKNNPRSYKSFFKNGFKKSKSLNLNTLKSKNPFNPKKEVYLYLNNTIKP